jgi:AcrR family transcriptional regulator
MNAELSTRERLLEAAIEVISLHGEAAVRVDAIADTAEITKPSIYHFFGDRDGLIIAAQAERFRRAVLYLQSDILALLDACTTRGQYAQLLTEGVRLFGSPEGAARRQVRIEVLGSAASRPALREAVNQIVWEASQDLARIFDVGRSRGWVTETISSESIAILWYGSLLGRHLVETNPAFDPAEWDRAMTKVILHLVLDEPDINRD